MNELVDQLFEIATNEEFNEDQRRGLMQIAIADYAQPLTMYPCEHSDVVAQSFAVSAEAN